MWGWLLACAAPEPPAPAFPRCEAPREAEDTGGAPGETGRDLEAPAFVTGPAVELDPGPALLVGRLTAVTDRPAALEITVDDGAVRWTQTSAAATRHEVLLLGLRPGARHHVSVVAVGGGRERTLPLYVPPLPDWPRVTVTSDPARMEPGLTLTQVGPYLAMLDAAGVARWALPDVDEPHEATVTPRGTVRVVSGRTRIVEVDLAGNEVASWRAARTHRDPDDGVPVDVAALHHDAHELPNGNLLALSIERRRFPDYPTSETDPGAPRAGAWVAGDVVVELAPDGAVVNAWPLLDRLDPYRFGYDGIEGAYWEAFYGGDDVKDWSHANAVWYDAERDEVLVGLRHQDAVVALDHATGEVTWILAPEAGWRPPWDALRLRPAGPAIEPFHPHGAKLTPAGRLMLFDNGSGRASPFDAPLPDALNRSRGLELALDHTARTWTATLQVEASPPVFADTVGDCDPLPRTGNVLVTFGNVTGREQDGVQILEATRTDPPEVVFDLRLPRPAMTFRAQRVTGVLPVEAACRLR